MTSIELVQNVSRVLNSKEAYPAFSFFFRIHSGSEKQLHDSGHIRNRVHEVLKEANLSSSVFEEIKTRADQLVAELDFESGALSVGLFVSPSESFLSEYFVNLPERNYVGDCFSSYETLYAEQESSPYLLILLEPAEVKAYRGHGDHLEAILDSKSKHLQAIYRRRPASHPDKDGKFKRGQHHDSNWKQEFLEAIADVCCGERLPAFFSGSSLADLNETELSSHGIEVLGILDEVFQSSSSEKLKTLVQDFRALHRSKNSLLLQERCKTATGSQKLARGLNEVIECAKDGRGEILILPYPCWEATGTLPMGQLNEAIRATVQAHGSVQFLPGELMKEWEDAALILRY